MENWLDRYDIDTNSMFGASQESILDRWGTAAEFFGASSDDQVGFALNNLGQQINTSADYSNITEVFQNIKNVIASKNKESTLGSQATNKQSNILGGKKNTAYADILNNKDNQSTDANILGGLETKNSILGGF